MEGRRSTRSGGGTIGTFQRQSGTAGGGDRIHEGKLPARAGGGPVQGQCRGPVRPSGQNVQFGSAGKPRQLRCDGGRLRTAVTVPGAGGRADDGATVAAGPGSRRRADEKFVQLGAGHRLDVGGLLRVMEVVGVVVVTTAARRLIRWLTGGG